MLSLEKVLKEILPIYSIYSMDNTHLRQEYKGKKERTDYNERYELWKAIERYTIDVGSENDGKLNMCKFKKMVRKEIDTDTKSIKRF